SRGIEETKAKNIIVNGFINFD
ncbi:MAG: hypothetical protein UV37_C0002G0001, partial [Candidatus Collierbacteria bacterium GW2011_GWA1_42_60]